MLVAVLIENLSRPFSKTGLNNKNPLYRWRGFFVASLIYSFVIIYGQAMSAEFVQSDSQHQHGIDAAAGMVPSS